MSGEQPATGGDLWALAAATESATALLAAVEGRAGHSPQRARDVSALAVAVGRSLGLDAGRLSNLEWSARLHDIGMLGVPAEILSKPGALDAAERAEMHKQAEIAERIVSSTPEVSHLARGIRAGHERWDGTGYPDGLRGNEIPIISRIVYVCDAYYAMTSERPYRQQPLTPAEGRAELERHAGTQFCPTVVEAALTVLNG